MIALGLAAGLFAPLPGALAFAQMLNGDLHFFPSPNSHTDDNTGRTQSPAYLFSLSPRSFRANSKLQFQLPWNSDQHTFLFGPSFHISIDRHLSLNVWALGGVAKRFALMDPLRQPVDATPPHFGLPFMPVNQSNLNGENGLTMSLGGAADYRVGEHLTFRIIQPEYLLEDVKGSAVGDRRVSTGLRFSFGK